MEDWIQRQSEHTLYFDGASKGNLGEAGVGGGFVLYEPGGKIILNYYWNLGKDTNNKA